MENVKTDELRDIPLETVYWLESTDVTEEQIKNMAASLRTHGQIEPVVVCERDEKGYRGVVGRLRYEGMKRNPEGKSIQARVHKFDSELELRMWQMVENLHRREIPAMQRARQYRALYETLKGDVGEEATIKTLATTIEDMTGEKESIKTIQHYLSLTNLQEDTQKILTCEKMPLRYGLELLRVKDPDKQVRLAKGIRDIPSVAPSVDILKDRVDGILSDERSDKRHQQLKEKVKELRREGKTAYLDGELGWNEKDKKIRSFQYTLTPIPEECGSCNKLGILLHMNFHQEPICTGPQCYEKKYKEKTVREKREQEESTREWQEEKDKVCKMNLDIRHWRLALCGLIDAWELINRLHLSGKVGGDMEKAILEKVQSLSEEECKKILICHAVEEVLTGPRHYGGEDLPVKTWAVEQFGLKKELFIEEDSPRSVTVPCDTCVNGDKCDRTKFYALESGELTCDYSHD